MIDALTPSGAEKDPGMYQIEMKVIDETLQSCCSAIEVSEKITHKAVINFKKQCISNKLPYVK